MKNNTEFPTILKNCRIDRKLSQTKLGDKTGIQSSAICRFETGYGKPSCDNLIKLADELEVTTDYLLGRELIPDAYDLIYSYSKNLNDKDRSLAEGFMKLLANKQGEIK